jgi:hypothetical protein
LTATFCRLTSSNKLNIFVVNVLRFRGTGDVSSLPGSKADGEPEAA